MSEVRLSGIRKRFGQSVRAVHDLDLHVRDGEFFVLLGPSGCGKTTTLRCIGGLEEPDAGRIEIGGDLVADAGGGRHVPPEKRDLGMVFQSYALWPHKTVRENIGYPLKMRGWRRDQAATAIDAALDLVGLRGHGERYPAELSGGQQQRVALARATVARPRLLLFDEPLSNLDAQLRARLRFDLRRVHREVGFTAIYVTHDHSEALALADRIAVMNGGRIEQVGTPAEIFMTPRTRFAAAFVGFDNLLDGQVQRRVGDQVEVVVPGLPRPLSARAAVPLREGQAVVLAARAAQLVAQPEQAATDDACLRGVLREAGYVGDRYQGIASAGDHELAVTLPLDAWAGAKTFNGVAVRIATPASELVALPSDLAQVRAA
ncbi:ABC transporter ATP-binding protein [Pseudoxanthomonas winnipegensis]|uniref:ABC transporter ATP-binding protein n=1 Tax=Pseudoxanthomonas winnipegensis TaxID=2480810 RepID=UPI001981442B|nr:ABC transporter ATP-binding protein [Pseudoxanthomonas winnipegensis]